MPPSITHHTSHTMGNGASSSNSGCNINGGASITHQAGHAMGNTMANTTGEDDAGISNHHSGIVEASLTDPVADDDYCFPTGPSSRRSSVVSVSHDDLDDSDAGTSTTGITTMSNSVNLARFSIIDSTLREGEQMATANFNTAQKLMIAQALDDFGVDYIELTSPAASPQSRADCEAICKLGLKAKILCHIRCNMDDARIAVSTGVDGINMCIGTSPQLMAHSHGKDLKYIAAKAKEVVEYVRSEGIEIRFSGEDSFRSDFSEILKLYSLVDSLGADRVGIADTVGGATPMEVFDKIEALRKVVSCDIETHFHNDTGCAIANAFMAVEAGATHIDTTVLGIGERNGITPLGGLIACLLPRYPESILNRYKLEKLGALEELVAGIVSVEIPFNRFAMPSQKCD
ncbi:HMGL-like-domain-containing protein [Nemania sp. NC0429]|nr:HMGL-like-domain-containing protein [Nemania sp. NC0429]